MASVRAVVSGGTGFIGSRLVRALLASGAQVRVLSSGTVDRARLESFGRAIRWHGTSDHDLDMAVSGATHFFNFAVAYDRPAFSDALLEAVNVDLPLRVITRLQASGQPTTCVLGDSFFRKFPPEATRQGRYTRNKVALAERLDAMAPTFAGSPLRVALLRIEQVYGPGEAFTKAFPLLTRQMFEHTPRIATTHGKQRRDFIHVDDVVSAALAVASADWRGLQVVDCGTGDPTSVRTVLERLKALTGSPSVLGFGDLPSDQSIDSSSADTAWLRHAGWTPRVILNEGLAELVQDVSRRLDRAAS